MLDFGSYVSAPLARGQSNAIDTIWYFRDNAPSKHEKTISGFQFDFIAANQVFKDSVNAMNASILGMRAGIFHEFVPTNIFACWKESQSGLD